MTVNFILIVKKLIVLYFPILQIIDMQIFRIATYYKREKKFNVTIDALLFKKNKVSVEGCYCIWVCIFQAVKSS